MFSKLGTRSKLYIYNFVILNMADSNFTKNKRMLVCLLLLRFVVFEEFCSEKKVAKAISLFTNTQIKHWGMSRIKLSLALHTSQKRSNAQIHFSGGNQTNQGTRIFHRLHEKYSQFKLLPSRVSIFCNGRKCGVHNLPSSQRPIYFIIYACEGMRKVSAGFCEPLVSFRLWRWHMCHTAKPPNWYSRPVLFYVA